jgi:pyruvate formate lyase activating enzyme
MTSAVTCQAFTALVALDAIRQAILSEPLPDGAGRCNICQWRCRIPRGGVGHCKTVVNHEGTLYTTIYGVISSAGADPIEKKPVFHYKPGSLCFSVGTLGCNFRCVFCQNWEIAYADAVTSGGAGCRTGFTPADLVRAARQGKCEGVSWTYNEPAIWLNYTLDCARICKDEGLYTVYVTNGYATPEGLDLIGPYLDVYRVDIKSMEDRFYRELVNAPSPAGVLDVAVRAKQKWGMHIECVTNIIPGWNDSEDNLTKTARWIADSLGDTTPWHVTRFFPYGELSHIPPTPP